MTFEAASFRPEYRRPAVYVVLDQIISTPEQKYEYHTNAQYHADAYVLAIRIVVALSDAGMLVK